MSLDQLIEIDTPDDSSISSLPPISKNETLHSLEYLNIDGYQPYTTTNEALQRLLLPALKYLRLELDAAPETMENNSDVPDDQLELGEFASGSEAPLQSLIICSTRLLEIDLLTTALDAWNASLKHLELIDVALMPQDPPDISLLEQMTTDPTSFLPNLEVLIIRQMNNSHLVMNPGDVFTMLKSRWPDPVKTPQPTDQTSVLRKVVLDSNRMFENVPPFTPAQEATLKKWEEMGYELVLNFRTLGGTIYLWNMGVVEHEMG